MDPELILESPYLASAVGALGGLLSYPLISRIRKREAAQEPWALVAMALSGGLTPPIILQFTKIAQDATEVLLMILGFSVLAGLVGFLVANLWRGNFLISRVLESKMISMGVAVLLAVALVYLLQQGDEIEYHTFVVAPAISGVIHRMVLLTLYGRLSAREKPVISKQIDEALGIPPDKPSDE